MVDLPPHAPYLALSYVWGRNCVKVHPAGLLYTLAGLGNVPLTISDAIRLTIGLGKRFLWVDRYCIDQARPDQFQQQLLLMGQIFSNAWATIIAPACCDRRPLPGVSVDRAAPPYTAVHGGTIIIETESAYFHEIWNRSTRLGLGHFKRN